MVASILANIYSWTRPIPENGQFAGSWQFIGSLTVPWVLTVPWFLEVHWVSDISLGPDSPLVLGSSLGF
jgi:uncharacterized membrane protein